MLLFCRYSKNHGGEVVSRADDGIRTHIPVTDFLQADLAPKATPNKDSAFNTLPPRGIFVVVGMARLFFETAPVTWH